MDENSFALHHIDGSGPIKSLGRHTGEEKGRRQGNQNPPKKSTREYVPTLEKAVQTSNDYCAKKGLPYRFRVYVEKNDVFIDLLVLDSNGNVVEERRKNVSHEDFARVIEDVTNIEGLFFDGTA
jgi:hypothetical protein